MKNTTTTAAKKTYRIKVNGTTHVALDALSYGPGSGIHTYELAGFYVYRVAAWWYAQHPGRQAFMVEVEELGC
jgi:hypothetical protein